MVSEETEQLSVEVTELSEHHTELTEDREGGKNEAERKGGTANAGEEGPSQHRRSVEEGEEGK